MAPNRGVKKLSFNAVSKRNLSLAMPWHPTTKNFFLSRKTSFEASDRKQIREISCTRTLLKISK